MTEYNNYIKYINNNLKLSKQAKINFDDLFDQLMSYCLEYNKEKFGLNYSSTKCFIHVKGGACIKYNMIKLGLDSKETTDDIDLIMVPFENNPNIRIKLIEEFIDGLKKKFNKYMWTFEADNKLTQIYLNDMKIFDIVFYDSIDPWYNHFVGGYIFPTVIKNLGSGEKQDTEEYFNKLKKLFESDYTNIKTLEEVTFTSLKYNKQALLLIKENVKDIYTKQINELKKLSGNHEKEIREIELTLVNRINRYNQKLEYVNKMLSIN